MLIGRVSYDKRVFPVLYDKDEKKVYEIFHPINEVLQEKAAEYDMDSVGIDANKVKILFPVKPSKIVCVGRNYVEHAKELGNKAPNEPILFFKPPSCLVPTKGKVVYPDLSKHVDYEGELALVIKRPMRKIKAETIVKNPQDFYGYTGFLDMTARDIQKSDKLWTRGKGFDTFGPLGPWIEMGTLPSNVKIQTFLNDELKQDGNISLMIFNSAQLLEYITRIMTLEVGDIVATGTPAGVGPVKVGDKIRLEIGRLEPLEVEVKKE